MRRLSQRIVAAYNYLVLDHPVLVIVTLALVIGMLGYQARDFKIDASAESLLLENDADLRYAREISERYGSNDYLIISYTPRQGDLLSDGNLEAIGRLRDQLSRLDRVDSVLTLLDVPLLESPPISYKDISESIPNLQSPGTDKALARVELSESPFYRDLLVSRDMKTTALIVNLKVDQTYAQLLKKRNGLNEKRNQGDWTARDEDALSEVSAKIDRQQDIMNAAQHRNIAAVRAIMDGYRDRAQLFLGGISMIADDMISFIKSDLKMFGLGVFFLLLIMLGIIFKNLRWIALPMLCCFLSVVAMMGLLSFFDWKVTVISSNFISLQLIITLAVAVHLIVRYREFQADNPEMDRRTLVQKTMQSKFVPCLYATLTTIAGFGSLLLCDIKPVIQFGWMMGAGILLSLALTFVLFPAALVLMKRPVRIRPRWYIKFSLPEALAGFTRDHGLFILAATGVVSVLTVMGVSRLVVENSFIDYFKQSTEIYQGMKVIDQKLGGTTPLDVIVKFQPVELEKEEDPFAGEDDLLLPEGMKPAQEDENKYWFLDDRMHTVEQVHDYLDSLPETGKVLSLATMLKIGRDLNKGQTLDSIELAVLYTKLPEDYKKLILLPFVSFDKNEARFSVRIKDSLKSLKRDALLKKIKKDLVEKIGLKPDKVRLAGTMVLYNNMLQSLYQSQIKTLGVVALALMLMFLVLFRSLTLSLIAIFPNLLSAGAVLGVMGWLDIPLDMMTITIAAISIGIAVDDTIHYIYRFREEFKKDHDYIQTMLRCHGSIGQAMYYTSITIIIGFSILVLSNFWPTIYFGLFTGLAMLIALLAALTLLPQLIVWIKPFGPQGEAQ
ncbi:MAG: MMPL family transporter [Desulfosarcinaceae bacterium]